MPDQIDIPDVLRRRCGRDREAGGDHRRRAGASVGCSRTRSRSGGARVALVARTETDLKAVADGAPGTVARAQRRRDRRGVQRSGRRRHRRPSGVASTSGSATRGSRPSSAGPRETDPSVWREILDVNLTGAFLGARAAARVMREGGRLIFTGSVLGERPREGLTAYSASKAGPRRHGEGSRARPRACGHHRERRRAGVVRLAVGRAVEEQPRARRRRARGTPRNGAGAHPTDLAGAYQFLASDASAFVTGTVLNVDGGYLLV